MKRLSALVLLFVVFSAHYTSAEETRVAVIVLPGDDKPREALVQQEMLDEAFQKSGDDLPWILLAFQRITPELTQGDVSEMLDVLMKKGKKAYQYMKLAKAQKYFAKATTLMRKRPLTRCNPEQPAEMYLYWARSVLDAGDETKAQHLLEQIQRFDKDAEPDPAVMPPKLVATFDLASDERASKPIGKTLLEIGPSQGTIVVNCKRMPPGVVEYTGVAGDELWIAAEITGGTFASTFTLPAGKRRQITIFSGQENDPLTISRRLLSLSRRMPSLETLRTRPDSDLDRLAGNLGVKALLLGQIKNRGSAVLYTGLYIPSKGLVSDPSMVPMNPSGKPDAKKLAEAFSSMAAAMASPSVMAALNPPEQKDEHELVEKAATTSTPKELTDKNSDENKGSTAWYKTWWFWTATGVVLAGAVTTGLVLGLSNSAPEPSGKVVLTISEP